MKQQTAVKWLYDCIPTDLLTDDYIQAIFKQAKEMEKQQMIKFADDYEEYSYQTTSNNRLKQVKTAEEYYNETYKK